MAALFAKQIPGRALTLSQRNPGAAAGLANLQSAPAPSYSPPRGQLYGVDPMLMRIAMQKQMFEQRQKERAAADALRRGFESAKRWHDERRGSVPPAAYGTAADTAPPSAASAMPQAGAAGVQTRGRAEGMVRFQDSQGGIHDIPHENLGRAWQRDRGLKVIAG
jgi:hypothetical protein